MWKETVNIQKDIRHTGDDKWAIKAYNWIINVYQTFISNCKQKHIAVAINISSGQNGYQSENEA